MNVINVAVELQSPLLAGDPRPAPTAQVQRSAHYLPGAMLRGAVGSELVKRCNHQEHPEIASVDASACAFQRLFQTTPPPRFGPCYPSRSRQTHPFPVTARTCNYYPGFQQPESDAHGIQDILLYQWVTEQYLEKHQQLPADYQPRCDHKGCEAKLDRVPGYYEFYRPGVYYQPRLHLQRFSRVAIDRRRYVAADELLYTLEVIAEEMGTGRVNADGRPQIGVTRLAGKVWVEKEAALVVDALEQVAHLGGDAARGLGAVKITVDSPYPLATTVQDESIALLASAAESRCTWAEAARSQDELINRIACFNEKMQEIYQQHQLPWETGKLFFCIDLLAPTIWMEHGVVCSLLPENLAGAQRVRAFASAHVHGGWHTGARMMRRTELAIDAGSVFLYVLTGAGDQERLRVLLNTLIDFETHGVGRECERGYGWVQVCTPFHLEVKPL